MTNVFERHDFSFKWSYAEMATLIVGIGYDWALDQTAKCVGELIELARPDIDIRRTRRNRGSSDLVGDKTYIPPPICITTRSADDLDYLDDRSVDVVVIDPPYYDNVMYSELSDFFYVWLKRTAGHVYPDLFTRPLTDKESEAVANPAKFKDMSRPMRQSQRRRTSRRWRTSAGSPSPIRSTSRSSWGCSRTRSRRPPRTDMAILSDHVFKSKYSAEDGDIVHAFYVPALSCAARYDRTTGFFSVGALLLAVQGVEGLVRNRGQMRLIVGGKLEKGEVDAIERRLSIRDAVDRRLRASPLAAEDSEVLHALELLDRAREILEDAEPWDLVVVDEAHHARRRAGGTGSDDRPNLMLRLLRQLKERTQALILLTATPMQVSPIEIWDLLDLLGLPEQWHVKAFLQFFQDTAAASPSHEAMVRMARLFQVSEARWGRVEIDDAIRFLPSQSKIGARRVLSALRDHASIPLRQLEAADRRAAIKLMQANSPVGRLVSRYTRSVLRRYRDAGKLTTPIADRQVEDLFVVMTDDERQVYEEVERYISSVYNRDPRLPRASFAREPISRVNAVPRFGPWLTEQTPLRACNPLVTVARDCECHKTRALLAGSCVSRRKAGVP